MRINKSSISCRGSGSSQGVTRQASGGRVRRNMCSCGGRVSKFQSPGLVLVWSVGWYSLESSDPRAKEPPTVLYATASRLINYYYVRRVERRCAFGRGGESPPFAKAAIQDARWQIHCKYRSPTASLTQQFPGGKWKCRGVSRGSGGNG